MSNYEHDNTTHIRYCAICHRSEETAGHLVDMPGGLSVCPNCMQNIINAASTVDYQSFMNELSKGNLPNPADFGVDVTAWGLPPFSFGGPNTTGTNSDNQSNNEDNVMPANISSNGNADHHAEGTGSLGNPEDAKNTSGSDAGSSDEGSDEDGDSNADSKEGSGNQHRRPTVSFVNLGDIFGGGAGLGRQPKVKKKKKTGPKPLFTSENIPAPHLLKAELDKYVIGQEKAKKTISVAAYNHYKRVKTGTMDDIEIEKSNILLIGPTGAGKTYLVRTLARLLDVPLAITDATSLTEAGYIGDDVESCISKLLAEADNDVDKAQRGIIFIDEIDKLAKKQNTNSRDVSGEAVQQGLLKLLEGSEVEVPVGASSKNAMVPTVTVDTSNILFICGGAFPALEGIIRERLNKQSSMGFSAELRDRSGKNNDVLTKVTNEDLRSFGMIPEFIGRLPITCTLQDLDEEMLVRILKEPKNAIIKQYQKLLALDDVVLDFDEEALHAIAKKAMEKDTGARALRSIIENFMMDIMYEIPKDKNIGHVTITEDYVNGHGGPRIEIRQDLEIPVMRLETQNNNLEENGDF